MATVAPITIARGQLVAPATPKQTDVNTERMRITDEQKIVELQQLLTAAINKQNEMLTALHAAGVAGF
jgi:hypothetical protein